MELLAATELGCVQLHIAKAFGVIGPIRADQLEGSSEGK